MSKLYLVLCIFIISSCSTSGPSWRDRLLEREQLRTKALYENMQIIKSSLKERNDLLPEDIKGVRIDAPQAIKKDVYSFVRAIGLKENSRAKLILKVRYRYTSKREAQQILFASGYSVVDALDLTHNGSKKYGKGVVVDSKLYLKSGETVMVGVGGSNFINYLPEQQICGTRASFCDNGKLGALKLATRSSLRTMR